MLRETLLGMAVFFGYYAATLTLLVGARALFRLSGEWFRKLLHFMPVMSVFIVLYAFETWAAAVITLVVFALVVYVVVALAERFPQVMQVLEERRSGEIRFSIILVSVMMAGLVTVFWGWLGPQWKYVILLAVMAWGFGDAAAALVGKTLGRRKIRRRCVEGSKSVEGTVAMLVVSAVALLITLAVATELPWYISVGVAGAVAPVCAVVELFSPRGSDTITVPLATAATAFGLIQLFSAAGAMG